jgi:hypothetical protein
VDGHAAQVDAVDKGIAFEVLVSKGLFQEILERIHRLKPVPIGYG